MITHYLREHRERAGLTQDQLALRCGTFPSVISRYESGGRAISLEMAVRLCQGLGIKLGQLIEPPGAPGEPDAPSLDRMVEGLRPEKVADVAGVVSTLVKALLSP